MRQGLTVGRGVALADGAPVDAEDGLADDLLPGAVHERAEGRVAAQEATGGVLVEDRHRDGLEQLLEEVGALGRGLLCPGTLTDVVVGGHEPS